MKRRRDLVDGGWREGGYAELPLNFEERKVIGH
jgi:hypothetical protein